MRNSFLFIKHISFFIFAVILIFPCSVFSQQSKFVDEGKKYFLLEQQNGFIVTCFASYPDKDDKSIFCSALLWSVENICTSQFQEIISKDFSSKELVLPIEISSRKNDKVKYYAKMSFKVDQARLIITLYDIRVTPSSLFATMPVRLEKYKNIDKPKNKELLNEFVETESLFINNILDYINNKQFRTDYWDDISHGRLKCGMTVDECKCVVGTPSNIQNNGDETQWIIGMSTYLFFNNNILTNVIK